MKEKSVTIRLVENGFIVEQFWREDRSEETDATATPRGLVHPDYRYMQEVRVFENRQDMIDHTMEFLA